jgi:HAD superfamily hydrolase (TIGR01509 family)
MTELSVLSWDLDGTLYDMAPMRSLLHRQAVGGLLRSPWRGSKDLARLLRYNQSIVSARGDAEAVAAFFQSDEGQEFLLLQAQFISAALRKIGPRPDCARVMAEVRSRGLRQVVFSDYNIGEKLVALGLTEWVDHVVVAADSYQVKPDPLVFARMCEEMGVSPHEVLHVGDRVDTDGGAEAAGCRGLIIGRDIASLTEVLDSL